MNTTRFLVAFTICSPPLFSFLAFPARTSATIINLSVELTNDQESPSVVAVPEPTSGLATVAYDDVANTFDLTIFVTGIVLADLAANPDRFHLHGPASPGSNAPPIVDLGSIGVFQKFGNFILMNLSGVPLSAANEADLLAGRTYLNLHTTDHPSGEIRGQVVPEPATLAWVWVAIVTCCSWRPRRFR